MGGVQRSRSWGSRRRWYVAVLALVASAVWAPSALAAFPGNNGKLVIDRAGSGIATVNSDGTGLTFLTFNFTDHAPVWSSDGTKIAFQQDIWDFENDESIGSDIVVMNADGTGQVNLTNNPPGEFDTTPAFSPDGVRVAYASSSGSQTNVKTIFSVGTGETTLHVGGKSPAWSSDNRIAFAKNGAIWVMKSDGAEPIQVTTGTSDGEPDWSPNSKRITYERQYCDASQVCRPEIQIVDATGANNTRLTNDANAFDETPVFAPNGTKIVWSVWNTITGNTSLFSMNPDGSAKTSLNVDADRPDWQALPVNTASTHVRPKGATPMYMSLVPAFHACSAGNRLHGPPLVHASCNPPQLRSTTLTIGGDTNPAQSIGSLRMILLPGAVGGPDDTDVRIAVSLTNVMRTNLTEYLGGLRIHVGSHITDRESGVSSTTGEFPLAWSVPCFTTPDPNVGATCQSDTTIDAVLPGGAVEGSRGVWGLEAVEVFDGGPDFDANTEADNSLLATQGVFVP